MTHLRITRRDVAILVGCVALAVLLALTVGCETFQGFKPQTQTEWVTAAYAEVEDIADSVTKARQPDELTGEPPLLSAAQGAEIKAILQDIIRTLQAAEVVIGRGEDATPTISKARLGVSQARALLHTMGVQ